MHRGCSDGPDIRYMNAQTGGTAGRELLRQKSQYWLLKIY